MNVTISPRKPLTLKDDVEHFIRVARKCQILISLGFHISANEVELPCDEIDLVGGKHGRAFAFHCLGHRF